ncbi:hypothetical protein KAW38_01055 [Candidatus Micrarchaeota archaeon]|nr:hypothetical protein [Candidatus Micrarchaeota archaeon]
MAFWRYRKGSAAERELIKHFHDRGFAVIRAAGSGVSSLSPDLMAFKKGMQYAIESKAIETENLAIKKEQFENLVKWEETTGITSYIGWRRKREQWVFIPLSVFKKNKGSYSINWKNAKLIGRSLQELVF